MQNLFAVVVGIVLGSIVNMAIVTIGPMLIPVPEGVDMSDMEKLAENIAKLKPINFLSPWLGHALGTLAGAAVTAKLAKSRPLMLALVIGAFFLLGGVMTVWMIGGPAWFAAVDLVLAYLPMAYLGGWLTGSKPPESPSP